MSDPWDVIIIGAGAAGLMCAIEAGKRGRRVLVLDQAAKPAEKIRISGGGRCNFTNIHCTPDKYLSRNKHFCKSALGRYGPRDFIALVEKHGIAYHEKTLGQLFCDNSAQEIIDMLLAESAEAGVTIKLETIIESIRKQDDGFVITTDKGALTCSSLVIATGGPSIPKMGASNFAYKTATQFGLNVIAPRPALVPLTFTDEIGTLAKELSGMSIDPVEVSCGKTKFREALLFTHRGLSGPAILQISSYWRAGNEIILNLLPGRDMFATLKEARTAKPKQKLHTVLGDYLPARLAQSIATRPGADKNMADLSDKSIRSVSDSINGWRVKPNGTEGFRTAEVTAGGVDTADLSSQSFEAKTVPGLYFIGECIDVTGWLGGYNFQWAWASGYAAGQFV